MPMIPVDTAVNIIVGPCIDDTDFKSTESVAYDAAGINVDLLKSSDTTTPTLTNLTLTTGGSQDWTELGNGYHQVEITAAQNDTEGKLQIVGVATGVIPFMSAVYDVVSVAVYNSMHTGGTLATEGADGDTLETLSDQLDGITAAAISDAVWDEATADHVAAGSMGLKLGNVSALSGSNGHTVNVKDGSSNNLPGASVELWDSGNTSFVTKATTGGDGNADFVNLEASTYSARIFLSGYTFTVPVTVTVTTDGETTNATGTAVSAVADPNTYESRSLRRQKVRYNDANDENLLTAALIIDGEKQTPDSATITIYAPGSTTALVSAASMTVTGSLLTYAADTTTTASWPVQTGYRADIVVTVGATTYPIHLVFDVATYILNLAISKDQLVALDGNIRNMLHDSDSDLSELVEACRDEIQFMLETKAVNDGMLLENMVLDHSRLAIPARRYIIAQLYANKGNEDRANEHREIFHDMMRNVLASVKFDKGQDGTEETNTTGMQAIRLKT